MANTSDLIWRMRNGMRQMIANHRAGFKGLGVAHLSAYTPPVAWHNGRLNRAHDVVSYFQHATARPSPSSSSSLSSSSSVAAAGRMHGRPLSLVSSPRDNRFTSSAALVRTGASQARAHGHPHLDESIAFGRKFPRRLRI